MNCEDGLYCFKPIGEVKNNVFERKDECWGGEESEVVLLPEFCGGLLGLEGFSHVLVVTCLHQAHFLPEAHLQRRPQGRMDMPMCGIFAQRAKNRPNPIGITAVEVVALGESSVTVKGLDAIAGTPVLDLKPYYPAYDCRPNAIVPSWVETLMEGYF